MAAMKQESIIWIKEERIDDLPNEPGSTVVEDPLGISCSTDFIKEDPELNLEGDAAENIVVASTRYVSSSRRLIQNGGESCGILFEDTLNHDMVHSELELGTEKLTYFTTCGSQTKVLTSQEDFSFGMNLKCGLNENELHKFSCDFCLQNFPSKYTLIMHVFIHIDGVQPPIYVCKSCGEVFPSNVSLNKHVKMNEGNQVLSPGNDEKFDCSDNHEKLFLEADSKVSCTDQIEKKCSSRETWKSSKESLNDIRNTSTITLNARKRDRHDNNGISYTDSNVIDRAAKRVHKCDVCGKSYTSLKGLKRHALIHTEMRANTCDTCGKTFSDPSYVKKHGLIHAGIKPHKCDICGRSFTQLCNLKTHALRHTGMRKHKCDICGKSFTELNTLKEHSERNHVNEILEALKS